MNESGKPVTGGALAATFRCGACNEVAAIARYIPSRGTSRDPILQILVDQSDCLEITGFGGSLAKALDKSATAVCDALHHSSARQLYDIDFLYAPFYCAECHESYCWTCWNPRIVMDEEYIGWYDCTDGKCPKGHERMIND